MPDVTDTNEANEWYTENFSRYSDITQEALFDDIDIGKKAYIAGRNNEPAVDDEDLDQTQITIVERVRDSISGAHGVAGDALATLVTRRSDIETSGKNFSVLKDAAASLRIGVDNAIANMKDPLSDAMKDLAEAEASLRYFCRTHQINREARYPDSTRYHWAIMSAVILIESVMNSYFFSKGNDLGLLGGLFQAILISFINVGFAGLLGMYPLRWKNHVEKSWCFLGWLFVCLGGIVLVLYNLLVGHYRAGLETDPFLAITKALESFLLGPFNLNNFESIVLVCVGAIIAFFALAKVYFSDDVYPGYGNVHRKREVCKEDYEDLKKELRENVNREVQKTQRAVTDGRKKASDAVSEHKVAAQLIDDIRKEYADCVAHHKELLVSALNFYRAKNEEIRSTKPPAYFKTDYPFIAPKLQERPKEAERNEARHKELCETLNASIDELNAYLPELAEENERLNRRVSDEIATIEKNMAKQQSDFEKDMAERPSDSET